MALRRWGSLVARLEAPVTKARGQFTAAGCTAADYGPGRPVECSGGLLGIDFAVQAFAANFTAGARDLGAPPAELATLVTGTGADAAAAHTAYRPVDKSCGAQQSGACDKARFDYLGAVDRLGSDFDAWKPYTS